MKVRFQFVEISVLGLVILLLTCGTYLRNSLWNNPVALWAECLKKSPNKARPHVNMGIALARLGKTEEALTQFSQALQIDPKSVSAHFNLGVVLTEQGRIEEAMTHFMETLRIEPHHADAHYLLGSALLSQGKVGEGTAHLGEAIRIKPHHADAHKSLGIVLRQQGKIEEAIAHFREVLKINPRDEGAHNYLGTLLVQQGKIEQGPDNPRALQRVPTSPQDALDPDLLSAARKPRPPSEASPHDALDPHPLGGDWILTSTPDGISLLDGKGRGERIYSRAASSLAGKDFWVVAPSPIRSRPREPVIPDRVDLSATTGKFLLADVNQGRNMPGVKPGEVKRLLVLEWLPTPGMYMPTARAAFFLLRIHGTVPVEGDGSAYFEGVAGRGLSERRRSHRARRVTAGAPRG